MGARLPWPQRYTSRLGGDRSGSCARLGEVAGRIWATVRLVAASTLDVPDMEFKLASGELLHALVTAAGRLERRCAELGHRGRPDQRRHRLDVAVAAALRLDPLPDRLSLLGHRWLPDLAEAICEARIQCDPLLDAPSEASLRGIADELSHVLPWFADAAACVASGPVHADQLWDQVTRETTHDCRSMPSRPVTGARDDRFTTFSDTRDYRTAPGWVGSGSAYEDDLVELAWVNRDELDAIETFALALFDLIDQAELEVLEHLARLAWDESRHAAIGHSLLAKRGDPFSFPSGTIGIRLRGAMDGWDAWAQITLYGELSIIRPMRELAATARAAGDGPTADAFEFICSDEALHLRGSRSLLAAHHSAGGLEAASEQVRQRAAALFEAQGVLRREHYLRLSRAEIFRMVGE